MNGAAEVGSESVERDMTTRPHIQPAAQLAALWQQSWMTDTVILVGEQSGSSTSAQSVVSSISSPSPRKSNGQFTRERSRGASVTRDASSERESGTNSGDRHQQNRVFKSHKVLLAMESTWFRNYFSLIYSSLDQNAATCCRQTMVVLTNVSPVDFEIILNYLHTGEFELPKLDRVTSLLKTARFLGIQRMIDAAETILKMSRPVSGNESFATPSELVQSSSGSKDRNESETEESDASSAPRRSSRTISQQVPQIQDQNLEPRSLPRDDSLANNDVRARVNDEKKEVNQHVDHDGNVIRSLRPRTIPPPSPARSSGSNKLVVTSERRASDSSRSSVPKETDVVPSNTISDSAKVTNEESGRDEDTESTTSSIAGRRLRVPSKRLLESSLDSSLLKNPTTTSPRQSILKDSNPTQIIKRSKLATETSSVSGAQASPKMTTPASSHSTSASVSRANIQNSTKIGPQPPQPAPQLGHARMGIASPIRQQQIRASQPSTVGSIALELNSNGNLVSRHSPKSPVRLGIPPQCARKSSPVSAQNTAQMEMVQKLRELRAQGILVKPTVPADVSTRRPNILSKSRASSASGGMNDSPIPSPLPILHQQVVIPKNYTIPKLSAKFQSPQNSILAKSPTTRSARVNVAHSDSTAPNRDSYRQAERARTMSTIKFYKSRRTAESLLNGAQNGADSNGSSNVNASPGGLSADSANKALETHTKIENGQRVVTIKINGMEKAPAYLRRARGPGGKFLSFATIVSTYAKNGPAALTLPGPSGNKKPSSKPKRPKRLTLKKRVKPKPVAPNTAVVAPTSKSIIKTMPNPNYKPRPKSKQTDSPVKTTPQQQSTKMRPGPAPSSQPTKKIVASNSKKSVEKGTRPQNGGGRDSDSDLEDEVRIACPQCFIYFNQKNWEKHMELHP